MAFSMNSRKRTAMSEINVTPLVDVMLVLLIIFMVTAPMMQEGVKLDLPKAQADPLVKQTNVEAIVISVTKKGEIYIDDEKVLLDNLVGKIDAIRKKDPSREVHVRGDQSAMFGIIAQIMADLTNAGIEKIGIITMPEEKAAGQ
jgi:biopolymer transport protein TolR